MTAETDALKEARQIEILSHLRGQMLDPTYTLLVATHTARAQVMYRRDIMLAKCALHDDADDLLNAGAWAVLQNEKQYPSTAFYQFMNVDQWRQKLSDLPNALYLIGTAVAESWTYEASTHHFTDLSGIEELEVLRKLGFCGGVYGYSGHTSS